MRRPAAAARRIAANGALGIVSPPSGLLTSRVKGANELPGRRNRAAALSRPYRPRETGGARRRAGHGSRCRAALCAAHAEIGTAVYRAHVELRAAGLGLG